MLRPGWLLIAAMVVWGGCKQPGDGPEQAAQDYLYALAARDAEAIHPMLTPETRSRLARLHDMLVKTRGLIKAHYPASKRKEAMEATGTSVIDEAETPEALFMVLVARSGDKADLTGLQKAGTRTKDVVEGAERTVVTTWGGDNVYLVKVGDRWYVALDPDDDSRLEKLEAMAERNLGRVQNAVKATRKHQFGPRK